MEEKIELEESMGRKYRLDSINCPRCKISHKLMDGLGVGGSAVYWCCNEMMEVSEGDNINVVFEDEL